MCLPIFNHEEQQTLPQLDDPGAVGPGHPRIWRLPRGGIGHNQSFWRILDAMGACGYHIALRL